MATNQDFANVNKAVDKFEQAIDKKIQEIMENSRRAKDEKNAQAKKAFEDILKKIAADLAKPAKKLEADIKAATKDIKGEDKSISDHLKAVANHLKQKIGAAARVKVDAKANKNLLSVSVSFK